MAYKALKAQVKNRGKAPDAFLDELIAWGKDAPEEIFAPTKRTTSIRRCVRRWGRGAIISTGGR